MSSFCIYTHRTSTFFKLTFVSTCQIHAFSAFMGITSSIHLSYPRFLCSVGITSSIRLSYPHFLCSVGITSSIYLSYPHFLCSMGITSSIRLSYPRDVRCKAHDKKESRLRDSPPAAGRFCDIFHNRRGAIPAELCLSRSLAISYLLPSCSRTGSVRCDSWCQSSHSTQKHAYRASPGRQRDCRRSPAYRHRTAAKAAALPSPVP